jgi:error-prone DNA polymerase
MDRLAAAGALSALAGHRRQAAWAVAGVPMQCDLLRAAPASEAAPALAAPAEGENLVADYATLNLPLGRHPLSLLRQLLAQRRYLSTASLRGLSNNCPARCAGIVTCRQRPGTASGVVFLTLEDETGLANVIVHPKLAEGQRRELLSARLLGVLGVLQREGEVVHLIAKRLVDHSELLGRLTTSSRDFH